MSASPVCPRCGEQLVVRPGSTAQAWCHVHGAVTPLHYTLLVAHDASAAPRPAGEPDPTPSGTFGTESPAQQIAERPVEGGRPPRLVRPGGDAGGAGLRAHPAT